MPGFGREQVAGLIETQGSLVLNRGWSPGLGGLVLTCGLWGISVTLWSQPALWHHREIPWWAPL